MPSWLRLAHGPGSDTLNRHHLGYDARCGLLTGRDRIHSPSPSCRSSGGCGLLTGRDRIHFEATASSLRCSCGLLTGRDRIHYNSSGTPQQCVAACSRAGIGYTDGVDGTGEPTSCGLLTGRDRIHSQVVHDPHPSGLRLAHGPGSDTLVRSVQRRSARVAACSRAGIGYTLMVASTPRSIVAACSRAGIGYTKLHQQVLSQGRCGLLTGRDRIHSQHDSQ